MASLIEPIRRVANSALDVLLPPSCVLCGGETDAPGLLCGDCYGQIRIIGGPCCECCGAPFELAWHDDEGGLCQRCIDTPPPFERARAAFVYDKASRRLILPFKHGDRIEFALILARLMAGAGGKLLQRADILVPVPLHRRRLFFRRYNQCALLARALGKSSGREAILDALERRRATRSLDGKSAAERREEVTDAFAVQPLRAGRLAGRRVLLIDDVITSGATAGACARALLDAGVSAVDVLVAARVPEPSPKPARRRKRLGRHRLGRRRAASGSPARLQGMPPEIMIDSNPVTVSKTSAVRNG